jgi:outer membrane protein TolC
MLYPDLKDGSDDQRARWKQHMSAFRSVLDEVEASYQNYRQAIEALDHLKRAANVANRPSKTSRGPT